MNSRIVQDRLINMAVAIIDNSRTLFTTYEGTVIRKQIVRSSTSAALNYGEAKGTITTNDFMHNLSLVLKELRETYIGLEIIERSHRIKSDGALATAKAECNELVSIFTQSLRTLNSQKDKSI